MADLADILMHYGYGRQDPGPDEVYDTSNVLAVMRKREPNLLNRLAEAIPATEFPPAHGTEYGPDGKAYAVEYVPKMPPVSLANMLKGGLDSAGRWLGGNPEIGPDTIAPAGAGMMGAAAAKVAVPTTERVGGLWPEAVAKHVRQERKEGNPLMGPLALPFMFGAHGVQAAVGIDELLKGNALLGGGLLGGAAFSGLGLAKNHLDSIARIRRHLEDVKVREANPVQPARPKPQFRPQAQNDLEVPVTAATKYDDQVFKAPIHGMEEDAAFAALGPERFDKAVTVMGFVTNRGRFVTRQEAAALAKAADEKYKPYGYGMDSDDLR